MRLRARLALATVGAVVPMIAVLVWMDGRARHDAAADALIDMTQRWLEHPQARARCEAGLDEPGHGRGFPRPPSGHGMPPPPMAGMEMPRQLALDEDLRGDGLALGQDVRESLDGRSAVQLAAPWWSDEVEVVVRTPWREGSCAYVYVHGTTTRGFIGALLPSGWIWLLPVAAAVLAVLVVVGPVVRRLRRLTETVGRSAAADFAIPIPVEGSDEVGDLARAFGAAGREVRAQLQAKEDRERALRDFLANTTHDVMIPLSVLLAHLATLQEREREGEPHDREILTAAMDAAHYLGALVHNLAAVAKLDAAVPQLSLAEVDLNALLTRVIARHRPISQRLQVEIDHAIPDCVVTITGDVTLLEQAVSNLVYNAIRHNRAGGHVAAILDELDGDRFQIRVIDDGPGLPPAELARMVERGFRGGAARTRAPDGQGLGLDIAMRVAELHGLSLRFGASEYGGLQADLEGPTARS